LGMQRSSHRLAGRVLNLPFLLYGVVRGCERQHMSGRMSFWSSCLFLQGPWGEGRRPGAGRFVGGGEFSLVNDLSGCRSEDLPAHSREMLGNKLLRCFMGGKNIKQVSVCARLSAGLDASRCHVYLDDQSPYSRLWCLQWLILEHSKNTSSRISPKKASR
jgi:hypothetical protein